MFSSRLARHRAHMQADLGAETKSSSNVGRLRLQDSKEQHRLRRVTGPTLAGPHACKTARSGQEFKLNLQQRTYVQTATTTKCPQVALANAWHGTAVPKESLLVKEEIHNQK